MFPLSHFSAFLSLSLFLCFFLSLFFFFFVLFCFFVLPLLCPLIVHPLSSSPLVSFQSFSIFWQSFISVVVLLSTFPAPSYLRHLSPALSFLSPGFQPLFVLLSLPPLFSSPASVFYWHKGTR